MTISSPLRIRFKKVTYIYFCYILLDYLPILKFTDTFPETQLERFLVVKKELLLSNNKLMLTVLEKRHLPDKVIHNIMASKKPSDTKTQILRNVQKGNNI